MQTALGLIAGDEEVLQDMYGGDAASQTRYPAPGAGSPYDMSGPSEAVR